MTDSKGEAMHTGLGDEKLYTAILRCAECKTELNRAENVPESARSSVSVTAAFAAGRCPKGCRSTFSDLNINTDLEWVEALHPQAAQSDEGQS